MASTSLSTSPSPWNDLREAFITVKKDFLTKQTKENVTLKEVNTSVKMANSQLSSQIDKLKRLCHLCLNLIITNETTTTTTTSGSLTAGEVSAHAVPPMDDEIELLILEYLYSGAAGAAPGDSGLDVRGSPKLVKHFQQLMSRLEVPDESAEKAPVVEETEPEGKTAQHRRKGSLFRRLLHRATPFKSAHPTAEGRSRKHSTVSHSGTPPVTHSPLPPAPAQLTHAAASLAAHSGSGQLRSNESIQKLSHFFESQQENARVLPCARKEEGDGDSANEEANQRSVTNGSHLSSAAIAVLNGGVFSPTKSSSATEEHLGHPLSTAHISVNEIVDTAPKMSEVAMFCGLSENNVTNPLLNAAIRKENEKRFEILEQSEAKKSQKKAKDEETKAEVEESGEEAYGAFSESAYLASLRPRRPMFSLGGHSDDDDDGGEDELSSPADSVVDGDQVSQTSSLEAGEIDLEEEMERLLAHIHQHRWFVLPTEAAATVDTVAQLNSEVLDLNNTEAVFQILHRLWSGRRSGCTRLHFFYSMFTFLFDKYLNVLFCDCHQPPCAPSVEAGLFGKLATTILRRLLECINRSRHLIIQIEMLSSIESLVYNRPHYRPALSEVFHHLFTAGLVEATAFVEWAKLEDPSPQFEAAKKRNSLGNTPTQAEPPAKESLKPLKTPKGGKSSLKASASYTGTSKSPGGAEATASSTSTSREKLFQELKKAGFAIFKCKAF